LKVTRQTTRRKNVCLRAFHIIIVVII
jgi:hypothetical protein